MKRHLILIFALAATFATAGVALAASPELYEARNFEARNGQAIDYRVLFPANYSETDDFPLVLFLHGAGERGSDNLSQLAHGSAMFTNPVNRERFPAVVLFPQCPPELYWAFDTRPEHGFAPGIFPADYPATRIIEAVRELVENYIATEKIDPRRIYVVGLSMGGMATFDIVCRWPELFAAAVPICGGVNPTRLKAAAQVPFRIFHGDADDVVPVENSRNAYTALKRAGARVEYIEFPSVNHGSWVPAFGAPDFLEWMFKQHK